MRYVMLIYQGAGWSSVPVDEKNRVHAACGAWHDELVRGGHAVMAVGLQPPATAAVLRGDEGRVIVTDGPFAETREVLGGFELVECRDREEALALARRFPGLSAGCHIELRPLVIGNECRD